MDKALDEIISTKPKSGRRRSTGGGPGARRGGGRAQVLGKTPAVTPVQRAKAAQTLAKPAANVSQVSEKIMVSNLPPDVNEQQIKELFHSTVGPLKEVTLHFDANGRSKGIAAVQFSRKGDGSKAFAQYNNRLIDGKRPMKIEIILDPSRAPPASLASRVAPASGASNGQQTKNAGRGAAAKRGGRAPKSKTPRPAPKTAADLDAEMEDYTQATSAPAAAPAA